MRRWSPERDREIRRRYDAGESAKSIARSLRADRRTVRASLSRTGSVRTLAEAQAVATVLAGREAAVVAARERGASLRAIAAEFGVSAGAVDTCLRRAGFAVSPAELVRRRARRRAPGASYFESISDEARAYWLGFIAADGWLSRETRGVRFGVKLAERDRHHLAVLAGHLGLALRATSSDKVAIASGNAALVHDLRRAGIIERKSHDGAIAMALVRTPSMLRRHFVRGLFDGDGSAFDTPGGGRVLEFSGHVAMLERLRALAVEQLAIPWSRLVTRSSDSQTFATTRWRHPLDVAKLTAWLYSDATVWLERKRVVLELPVTTVGASVYRGVGRRGDKWHAHVGVGGRRGHVVSAGGFEDELSAARGYDRLVRALRGPRAPLNLPHSPFCDPATLSYGVNRNRNG